MTSINNSPRETINNNIDFTKLAYELINDKFSKAKYMGIECIMDIKTGFINATKFCTLTSYGKKNFKHYLSNTRYKNLFNYMSSAAGYPAAEITKKYEGGNPELRGTYVHPDLLLDLASWISPAAYIRASGIVKNFLLREKEEENRILTGANIDLKKMFAEESKRREEAEKRTELMLLKMTLQNEQTHYKLEQTHIKLDDTNNKLEQTHIKLDNTEKTLEDTNNKLEQTHIKLDNTEKTLEQTHIKLDNTEKTLEDTNNKLEKTHSKLEDTNNILEQTHIKLDNTEKTLEDTNIKLDNTEKTLEDTNNILEQTHNKLEDTNNILEQTHNKLDDANNILEKTHIKLDKTYTTLKRVEARVELLVDEVVPPAKKVSLHEQFGIMKLNGRGSASSFEGDPEGKRHYKVYCTQKRCVVSARNSILKAYPNAVLIKEVSPNANAKNFLHKLKEKYGSQGGRLKSNKNKISISYNYVNLEDGVTEDELKAMIDDVVNNAKNFGL